MRPIVSGFLSFFSRVVRRLGGSVKGFFGATDRRFQSAEYWESRYRQGGSSGSGSYGRLAEWKAHILNNFVSEHEIIRVLELGSGDGNQLSMANYDRYVGFDISQTAVNMCSERFKSRDWVFHTYSPEKVRSIGVGFNPQLVISLDVIFHLVEEKIFDDYMQSLFSMSPEYVVVYSSNGNLTVHNIHVRNWVFTDWVAQNAPQYSLVDKIKNPYPWDSLKQDQTSFADFYIFKRSAMETQSKTSV